jgi:hypothetical protein
MPGELKYNNRRLLDRLGKNRKKNNTEFSITAAV